MKQKILTTVISVFLVSILCFDTVFAYTSSDLQYWSTQAQKAREQAQAKQKEADQIKSQISVVDGEISQTEGAISATESQISTTESNIKELESKIAVEEDNLNKDKSKLNQVVATWYMEGESGLLESILTAGSLSEVVNNQQYFDSLRQQVESSIESIETLKAELELQKSQKETKLADLNYLKGTQADQKDYLLSKRTTKDKLLSNAKDAVSDLNAEAQKADAKAQEIRRVLATIYGTGRGTPQGSNLVSKVDYGWYYNQRDYNTLLSPSRLSIAEVGCLITSYAMVATRMGHSITPPGVVQASSFNTSGSWLWFNTNIGVSFNGKVPINWNVINNEIANNRPVVISVRIPGTNYDYNGDGSNHWIVITGLSGGKYTIHDPYWTNSSYSLSDVRSMKILR